MKTLIILIFITLTIGCATTSQRGQTVTESGPFTIIEKHPDQKKNLEESPKLPDCEWIIPGTPSAAGCEK